MTHFSAKLAPAAARQAVDRDLWTHQPYMKQNAYFGVLD